MLHLFKTIRQKLIAEGKTKRYLRYAAGEIILVVVGILLAIQLNNYNEAQQKKANGIEVLARMKKEIEQDLVYLDSMSREFHQWEDEARIILDSVLNGKINRLERLEQINVGRGTMVSLHLNRSSFTEFLSTGNDLIFKNKELKNTIVAFYQKVEIILDKVNQDNERFNQWLYENVDIALWHKLWYKRNLEYEDWSWLKDRASDKFRAQESTTLFTLNAIQANLNDIQEMKILCEQMISMISDEIDA